jgi:hypothetical protein
MGRLIAFAFIILGVVSAFAILHQRNTASLAISPAPQPAAVASAVRTSAAFSATGTLVFYPNNVEPVPYLFYQDSNGGTVAKALTFITISPIDSSWSGAHVSVVGTVDQEHVIVSRITYLSGP